MSTAKTLREPPPFDLSLPPIAVDPRFLPPLLPWGLLYNDLMPWCPDSLATSSFPSRKGVPPWTIQLELHYQKFHPQTWLTLAADDAIDSWFYRKVLQERDKQIAVYGEAHDSIQSALDAVLLRRYTRWGTIFALHGIRQIYLDTQLALHPAWTEPEALKGLEVGDYPLVSPVAAVGTVWPLPSEPPREDLLTTLHSINHAILFDHETPESRRAQPSGWGGSADCAELKTSSVQAAGCPPSAELSTTLRRRRNETAP